MKSIEELLYKQIPFSVKAFGKGERLDGIIAHIKEELEEVSHNPKDLSEWADVILLALDGAWRQGFSPPQIARAIEEKQKENIEREWNVIGPQSEPIHHAKEQ